MHNLYEILGINKDASSQTIKKAFRDKALIEHPDKGGDALKMALLTKAYQILVDPIKRKEFDKDWEIFNASDDTEEYLPSTDVAFFKSLRQKHESLPSAGVAFSKSYRRLHEKFINLFRQKPLKKNQFSVLLKAFSSNLYSCNDIVTDNLFSYINAKGDQETKLDIELISPEKAVEYFIIFLQGFYSGNNLKELSKAFYKKIKEIETSGQQANAEFKLYLGIYEILLVAAKNETPSKNILFSLQKITEFASHDPNQSMSFMVNLLQSKYFRNLFSQALHYYWVSEEDFSNANSFSKSATLQSLIKDLKSKISESICDNDSNNKVAKSLRYVRLILNLEKDLNKNVESSNFYKDSKCQSLDCSYSDINFSKFYREKAFHLLDWLPSLKKVSNSMIIVNTLLQIGIIFQKAAAKEQNPIIQMADEKLAAEIYALAAAFGKNATPDVQLYASLHSIKYLLLCHYIDEGILEALHHQALRIADLFPFFPTQKSNVDLIKQEDQTLVLMRQLLHALINKINDEKDATKIIEHSYVRIFYEGYEACIKNWYNEINDPQIEKKIRQRLMEELLISKQWTVEDIDSNLDAPWPFTNLDEQGWICHKLSLLSLSEKEANTLSFKTILGFEINYKTGEIDFIFDNCKDDERDYNRLLMPSDLTELIQRNKLSPIFFSLDYADSDMPYHPFNKIRFGPSTLYNSKLFYAMFIADYLLKFLTVGQEVQCWDPYDLRSLDRIISKLPNHLKKIIYDIQSRYQKGSKFGRFWIESEEVELAVDDSNVEDNILYAFGNIRMVVKYCKMSFDLEGNLVNKTGENEGWDCYLLTQDQKEELYKRNRIIENSALIIIKNSWELIFWENHKATYVFELKDATKDLICLSHLPRDSQEKIKTHDSNSLQLIYQIVLKAAEKTNMPHRYSREFIFAREFTKYYNEFAIYLPEFGRLRELSKLASLVNCMAIQYEMNLKEITRITKLLKYKELWDSESKKVNFFSENFLKNIIHHFWGDPSPPACASMTEEHDYWQKIKQDFEKDIRGNIKKAIEESRSLFPTEKNIQEDLNEIRNQLGSLHLTRSSPVIQEIYKEPNNIRKFSYDLDSLRRKIDQEIPEIIIDLEDIKKSYFRSFLLQHFEDKLAAELSKTDVSRLIDQFLNFNDQPLREHLVFNTRIRMINRIAKKLYEDFPEFSIDTFEKILNHSESETNKFIKYKVEKGLKIHEENIKAILIENEKVNQSFTNLGLRNYREEVNLEDMCLWVPTSYRHDSGGHSRFAYGGVAISGSFKEITNFKLKESYLRQVRKIGKRLPKNSGSCGGQLPPSCSSGEKNEDNLVDPKNKPQKRIEKLAEKLKEVFEKNQLNYIKKNIDSNLVENVKKQTSKPGKIIRLVGETLNSISVADTKQFLSEFERYEVIAGYRVKLPNNKWRILDFVVLSKDKNGNYHLGENGRPKPLLGVEIKSGKSPYRRPDSSDVKLRNLKPTMQGSNDFWITNERSDEEGGEFSITVFRYENFTKNEIDLIKIHDTLKKSFDIDQ